ncbi:MAG: DUF2029 domain-containing protein [Cytophagales bacterium]|nr:DUF2029 domain-containing protein [Cytophagales bacterium]
MKNLKILNIIIIILLIASGIRFSLEVYNIKEFGFCDFPVIWNQVLEYINTGILYPFIDNLENNYRADLPLYRYPPIYASLWIPFANLGIGDNIFIYHWILQLALYLFFSFLLIYIAIIGKINKNLIFIIMILTLNYIPFFETLYGLQLETLILLLLALTILFSIKQNRLVPGCTLGIATMLKIYPLIFLIYFVIKKKWNVLISFIITIIVLMIVSILVVGFQEVYDFYFILLPYMFMESAQDTSDNISLEIFFAKLPFLNPLIAKGLSTFTTIILVSFSVFSILQNRKKHQSIEINLLEISLFIPLLLMIYGNSWLNYQLLLMLSFFSIFYYHCILKNIGFKVIIPIFSYIIIQLFTDGFPYVFYIKDIPTELVRYMRFLSTFSLWLYTIFLLKQIKPTYSKAENFMSKI